MGYLFKCGFCKEKKQSNLRHKLLLWTISGDLFENSICNICVYKLVAIFKTPTLSREKKQQIMDQWNIEIK